MGVRALREDPELRKDELHAPTLSLDPPRSALRFRPGLSLNVLLSRAFIAVVWAAAALSGGHPYGA